MKRLYSLLLMVMSLAIAPINVYANNEIDTTKAEQRTQLNLNAASLEQLANLKGIGPKKAQAIVDYRESVGEFHHLDQLTEVKGIGKKLATKLKPQLTL